MTNFIRTIFVGLAVLIAVLIAIWLLFSLLSNVAYMDLVRGALLLGGMFSLVIGVILGSQTRLFWGLGLVGFGALTLASAYLSAPEMSTMNLDAMQSPEEMQRRVMERSPFFNAPMVLAAVLCAGVLASLVFKRGVDPGKVFVGVVAMLAMAAFLFLTFTGPS